jgi:hypothetical protein
VKHDTIRPAVDLPTDWFAHYHQPYPRKGCGIGDGIYDRAERCLGKSHYTYADYVAEGREWAASKGVPEIALAEHARCYAAVHCPPGKMKGRG